MSLFTFSSNAIYPSDRLPLTLISLEDWSFISVKGSDSKKYLQGQITIDLLKLKYTHYTLCAHCNLNGKVWTTLFLFHYKNYYAYIARRSISYIQIKELKKYAIFSNVYIEEKKNIYLLGVAGFNARIFLLKFFIDLPNKQKPVIHQENNLIIWINEPAERFLLALSEKYIQIFKKNINEKILYNNSQQWLSLDIESKFPIIDKISSNKFLPQEINLESLQAINFYKGCYYGQEIISRIYFRNLNKRALYFLTSHGIIYPKIGSIIETKIEKKWFKIGFLLTFVHIDTTEIWIQVVLEKSVNVNNQFKIYGFKNIFSMQI